MLRWDRENKRMYAYKSELARPSQEVSSEPNNVYKSFLQYKDKMVQDDVVDIFLPALIKAINMGDDAISIADNGIKVTTVNPGYFNDNTHHVMVKFQIPGFTPEKSQFASVLNLPTVSEDGLIEFESKKYALIHMLEQEPTISFEANETTNNPQSLKIKTGHRSIWIDDSSKMLKFRMSDRTNQTSKTKYTLIHLISEFANYEGYDIFDIWNEFANFQIINMFSSDRERDLHLIWRGANQASVNASDYCDEVVPRLTGTRTKYDGSIDLSYDCTEIRSELNELLSLDKAVGEVLAKDVESELHPGVIVAKSGDVIDTLTIEQFNAEGVYKIYVKRVPNIEGYYLDEDIVIGYAPPGLKISDELREHFPEETGMYTSRFYPRLEKPILYGEGEPLTSDMVNTIVAFGKNTINVRSKASGGTKKVLNFYDEIISNRQFKGIWIGKTSEEEMNAWYYMDKDKNFVKDNGFYTCYDFVALQSMCVKLFEGKWIEYVTNSDVGFRKSLVPLSEQYHRAFEYAVRECFKQMHRKYKTIYQSTPEKYLVEDTIVNEFYPMTKYFFKYLRDEAKCLMPLIGDNLHNPIAYMSSCTKANVYTPNKHSVADSQREIAIGSYGKIDPFEVPQSGKMGTVYNTCCGINIDINGKMKTKYYRVITEGSLSKIDLRKEIYLTSAEEESCTIADICSVGADDNGLITDNTKYVLCRVPSTTSIEKQTFAMRPIYEITHVNVDAIQPCSYATASIPFMNNNDAARAVFAVAQEKQAKGQVHGDEPDVITSVYETIPKMNDKFCLIAKDWGYVEDVNYDRLKGTYIYWIRYGEHAPEDNFLVRFTEKEPVRYEFPEYFNSKYSVTKIIPRLRKGDEFKKGDVIVGSNFVSDRGILTLGVNALVAYQCDGFNYEDGAHMSEAFSRRMSSYKCHEEEFTGNQRYTKSYTLAMPPETAYIDPKLGSSIEVSFKDGDNPFVNTKKREFQSNVGFNLGFSPMRAEGRSGNYGLLSNTISVDEFHSGDKTSNRHGNKGVGSVIEPTANMPRLMNGMAVDVCLNPLGVATRRNIGQINEAHCGLFCHVDKFQLMADAYNSISDEEISSLMSLTVDLMNSVGDVTPVINQYKWLFDEMIDGAGFIEHLVSNIDSIRIYAGCFSKKGTTKLIKPTDDGKLTETEVLIGYIHMFKLIQEAGSKVHARGGMAVGEPYTELGDAPTHGSSKGGGQQFGTMEMDALCAYGTPNYIRELTNERCDNAIARDNFHISTYLPKRVQDKYHIDSKGQRRSVTELLYSLLALGIMAEPENGEFLPLSKDNGAELAHWKPSVLQKVASGNRRATDSEENTSSETVEESTDDIVSSFTELILGSSK